MVRQIASVAFTHSNISSPFALSLSVVTSKPGIKGERARSEKPSTEPLSLFCIPYLDTSLYLDALTLCSTVIISRWARK